MAHNNLSQRQLQVGETVKRALVEIITKDFYDPFLDSISIVISEVRMTPDLKIARVFLVPMIGSKVPYEDFLSYMQQLSPHIRPYLSKKIRLRYLPEIKFILDSSFENASKISSLLST